MKKTIGVLIILSGIISGCGKKSETVETKSTSKTVSIDSSAINDKQISGNPYYSRTDTSKLNVSNTEWKKILPDSIYQVARNKATEEAFTGKYWNASGLGTYFCAVCGNKLFRSDAKFASTCGWPSFYEPVRENSVIYKDDKSHGMERIEVLCGRCESHLGHIFDDGPPPTGNRFCMNSIVLDFAADNQMNESKSTLK